MRTSTHTYTYIREGPARANWVVVAHPVLVFRIFPAGQYVLVSWIIGLLVQNPASAVYSDGVAAGEVGLHVWAIGLTLIWAALKVLILVKCDLQRETTALNVLELNTSHVTVTCYSPDVCRCSDSGFLTLLILVVGCSPSSGDNWSTVGFARFINLRHEFVGSTVLLLCWICHFWDSAKILIQAIEEKVLNHQPKRHTAAHCSLTPPPFLFSPSIKPAFCDNPLSKGVHVYSWESLKSSLLLNYEACF